MEREFGRVEISAQAGDYGCIGPQSTWYPSFTSGLGAEKQMVIWIQVWGLSSKCVGEIRAPGNGRCRQERG